MCVRTLDESDIGCVPPRMMRVGRTRRRQEEEDGRCGAGAKRTGSGVELNISAPFCLSGRSIRVGAGLEIEKVSVCVRTLGDESGSPASQDLESSKGGGEVFGALRQSPLLCCFGIPLAMASSCGHKKEQDWKHMCDRTGRDEGASIQGRHRDYKKTADEEKCFFFLLVGRSDPFTFT